MNLMSPFVTKIAVSFTLSSPPVTLLAPIALWKPHPSPESKSLPENRSKCPRPDSQSPLRGESYENYPLVNSYLLGFLFTTLFKGKNMLYVVLNLYANDTQNLDLPPSDRLISWIVYCTCIVHIIIITCYQSPIRMKINLSILWVILDYSFGILWVGLTTTQANHFSSLWRSLNKFRMRSFTGPFHTSDPFSLP